MRRVAIDASGWRGEDDLWAALLGALEAPGWHGRNLDALADSLGGGVNGVEGPVCLSIRGVPAALARRLAEVAAVIAEAGCRIETA